MLLFTSGRMEDVMSRPSAVLPKPTSTEIFYVAVGVASAIILLVAVVIFILYARARQHARSHMTQCHDRPRYHISEYYYKTVVLLHTIQSPECWNRPPRSVSSPPMLRRFLVQLSVTRKCVYLSVAKQWTTSRAVSWKTLCTPNHLVNKLTWRFKQQLGRNC